VKERRRFNVGGTVPSEGYVYVPRPEEERLTDSLREGRWVTVAGCRTMGKSSLVVHSRQALEDAGLASQYVDAAGQLPRAHSDCVTWISQLSMCVSQCNDTVGRLKRHKGDLVELLRLGVAEPLAAQGKQVLVIDEIDSVASLSEPGALLASFKALHTQQAQVPDFRRLVLCFVGLRPFYELADPTDGAASPLGESIYMEDFPCDDETVAAIAAGFPEGSRTKDKVVSRILHHTGGQPYLTIYLADQAARSKLDSREAVDRLVDDFLKKQRRRPMELLRLIQEFILSDQTEALPALSTYLGLLDGRREARTPQAPGADLLLLSGLVRTGDEGLEIKGPLFERHFTREWVEHQQAEIGVRESVSRRVRGKPSHSGKICILNTGGTIGMFEQPDGTVRPPRDSREFLARFHQITDLSDIAFVPLFNLDSVNVFPPQWAAIAQAIYDRSKQGYNGFVVAHGTDTMAFTASAVAFALGKTLSFPVVFTGSQTTADVPHGDALSNLYRACMVALEPIPEVVIAFGEFVFRAVRAQKKAEERFDAFESPTYPPLAYIGESVEVRSEFVRKLPAKSTGLAPAIKFQEEGILLLYQYPGLDPRFFEDNIEKREAPDSVAVCRGVVVQTSGAGNVSSRLPFSYVSFLEKAQKLGVPVIITSQFPARRSADPRFQTASWPLQFGAIPVGNMTAPAAVTKFHWVLGQLQHKRSKLPTKEYVEEVRRMMQTDSVGEIDM
jgi:L-asparaginase